MSFKSLIRSDYATNPPPFSVLDLGALAPSREGSGGPTVRLYEPRPRVHSARLDAVSSTSPTRHWCIGGRHATAAQDVDRIAAPDLYPATRGEIGQALRQKHEPLAGQPKLSKECFVEHECRGNIGMS